MKYLKAFVILSFLSFNSLYAQQQESVSYSGTVTAVHEKDVEIKTDDGATIFVPKDLLQKDLQEPDNIVSLTLSKEDAARVRVKNPSKKK
jgi:hypothetical protein